MNSIYECDSLDTLIYRHFKTRDNLAKALGVSRSSVQRWYTEDPRKLLYYIPKLVELGVDQRELVASVTERDALLEARV